MYFTKVPNVLALLAAKDAAKLLGGSFA